MGQEGETVVVENFSGLKTKEKQARMNRNVYCIIKSGNLMSLICLFLHFPFKQILFRDLVELSFNSNTFQQA